MDPFLATYEELVRDFEARKIPYDAPGFCDCTSFLEAERQNPAYLNHYASFIAKRDYSEKYLTRAKVVIDEVAPRVHKELVKNGRLGACVDISSILFRILEEEGIWSCCIKGSLTVTFPLRSGIDTKYFWSVDHGDFIAGHAWLYAPPYTVVDIAARQQPYVGKERNFIPECILTDDKKPVSVNVKDIVSPTARAELLSRGVPPHLLLRVASPYPDIFCAFPPIAVPGLRGATLKYAPAAIHAPQEKLCDITNMTFSGLLPWQLYEKYIAGKCKPKSD